MNASPEGIFLYFSFHVVVFLCQLAGLVQIIVNLAVSFYIYRRRCHLSLTFTTVCKVC